ncbi:MAG: glutathione peroxidase [Phycisphaerae bacterium]|nr:glutathione peroxidase [Phycisphaerae bacterium]
MKQTVLVLLASSACVFSSFGQAPASEPPAKPPEPAKVEVPPAATDSTKKDGSPAATSPGVQAPEKVDAYVLGFTAKDIDGVDKKLEDYKGKVVLIVNTASKCGYTKQYTGLEELYKAKKDAGLVVLAFPSNDFGRQEPKSEAEIKTECSETYGVTFPLFSKVAVKGPEATPLFVKLAKQPAPIGGEPGWNFTKYLVDRSGNVVGRFESRVKPNDPELIKQVDALLKAAHPK